MNVKLHNMSPLFFSCRIPPRAVTLISFPLALYPDRDPREEQMISVPDYIKKLQLSHMSLRVER